MSNAPLARSSHALDLQKSRSSRARACSRRTHTHARIRVYACMYARAKELAVTMSPKEGLIVLVYKGVHESPHADPKRGMHEEPYKRSKESAYWTLMCHIFN